MSEERPNYCPICEAPEVWCTCTQPSNCHTCGKQPTVKVYETGNVVISCYHDRLPSYVVASVGYELSVEAWNRKQAALAVGRDAE